MEDGKGETLNEKLRRIYKKLGETKIEDIEGKVKDYTENMNFDVFMGIEPLFINESNNPDPEYGTDGASGFDLRANLEDGPIVLESLERRLIPTGLFYALPPYHELQVRPRSGLALKNGISVLNAPGTVDSDYRGEVGVILVNLSKEPFTVNHGDRIAQGVFASSPGKQLYRPKKVESFTDETDRGTGGFGSTGVK